MNVEYKTVMKGKLKYFDDVIFVGDSCINTGFPDHLVGVGRVAKITIEIYEETK